MPFLRHRAAAAAADRLSSLPDELIDHILSFIPDTKFRARTSILSKRWRHLWSSQPSIFFRLPFNHGPRPPLGLTPDQAHHYITAVDTSLRASKTPILRTLSVDLPIRHTRFEARRAASRWLRIAAKKSIRELHLTSQVISPSLRGGDSSVPKSIFTCQSLTVLDIYRCNFSVPSSFQGFAVLATLSLQHTRITQRSLMNLLSKCPLVVNLKVGACSSIKRLCLSSGIVPKLRDLVVYSIGLVEVRVPGLASFMYVGSLSKLYLMDSPALVSATMECFGGLGSCFDRKKLVSAISTTETLRVNDWFFQDYQQENPVVVFKNLKKLHCDVKWMTNDVLCALAAFIGTSPNLEELCVNLSFGSRGQIRKYITSRGSAVPPVHDYKEVMKYFDLLEREMAADVTLSKGVSLESPLEVRTPLNHLKAVTVREYISTINESRLVKFLLGNAVALERLNVICFSRKNQCKVQEMFASFHKASQQVQISSDDRAVV